MTILANPTSLQLIAVVVVEVLVVVVVVLVVAVTPVHPISFFKYFNKDFKNLVNESRNFFKSLFKSTSKLEIISIISETVCLISIEK